MLRKILRSLIPLIALLPVTAFAHEGGPYHNYETPVPGEMLGLFALLIASLVLLFKTHQSPIANRQSPIAIRHSPFAIGLTLSLLSGLLFYLSFPPFDLGWLMWIALVPMIVAQLRYAENLKSQLPNLNLQR